MKVLALVLALAVSTAGQSTGQWAVGSWSAQFDGRTFLKLEVKSPHGELAGGISVGDIEVDEQGGLRRVKDAPLDLKPIVDVVDHGRRITFSCKNGNDTDRLELRLSDANHAELSFLLSESDREALAAEAVSAPKPIILVKQ
jgi:hypothetical protein